jgi:SPP1 gp7 family putative phage head morphogenesis protein
MSLTQTISNWFSPKQITEAQAIEALMRAGTDPIAFHTLWAQTFGPGIGNQPSHAALLRESLGIADTATRAIANRVSTLDPLVKVNRRMGGKVVVETLPDNALKRLLDHPHPDMTRANLFRLTTQYIITVGEAYWQKIGSKLGVPFQLHPIPPGQIVPVLSRGVVSGYWVTEGDGSRSFLDKEFVVRFYFPDPENPWGSEGYLGPEGLTADSLKFAGQHWRGHYENDATPKLMIETDSDATPLQGGNLTAFEANWKQLYHSRSGKNRGTPGVLPNGYKAHELKFQTGAEIVPLLQHWRDEQLMGMGVPRSILGQSESGDRSTAETNQYVFDRHTIQPVANLIADGITLQLAPDFDPSLFVEFAPYISADKEFDLRQEDLRLKNKVTVINEVREADGMEPVDHGSEPVGTFADVPYRPDERFDLEEDDPDALGDRVRGLPASTEPRAEPTAQVRAEWARQVQREKKFVPIYELALKRLFKKQRVDTIKNLYALEERKRIEVSISDVFDPDEWLDDFVKKLDPIRREAFVSTAKETLSFISDKDFNFTNAMKKSLRRQSEQLAGHVNKTTADMITRQLKLGAENGESISQLANRIRDNVFNPRAKAQAQTIARTEMLKASQSAQQESFEQSGVVEQKQWNTSLDGEVRDSHISAEGQIVDLDEAFVLGDGELADQPGVGEGGGELSAGNTINCRCFMTPVTILTEN